MPRGDSCGASSTTRMRDFTSSPVNCRPWPAAWLYSSTMRTACSTFSWPPSMVSVSLCKCVRTRSASSRNRMFSSRVPKKGSIFPAMCIVRLIHVEGWCADWSGNFSGELPVAGFPMAGRLPGIANRSTASRSPIDWWILPQELTATRPMRRRSHSRKIYWQPTVLSTAVQAPRNCAAQWLSASSQTGPAPREPDAGLATLGHQQQEKDETERRGEPPGKACEIRQIGDRRAKKYRQQFGEPRPRFKQHQAKGRKKQRRVISINVRGDQDRGRGRRNDRTAKRCAQADEDRQSQDRQNQEQPQIPAVLSKIQRERLDVDHQFARGTEARNALVAEQRDVVGKAGGPDQEPGENDFARGDDRGARHHAPAFLHQQDQRPGHKQVEFDQPQAQDRSRCGLSAPVLASHHAGDDRQHDDAVLAAGDAQRGGKKHGPEQKRFRSPARFGPGQDANIQSDLQRQPSRKSRAIRDFRQRTQRQRIERRPDERNEFGQSGNQLALGF